MAVQRVTGNGLGYNRRNGLVRIAPYRLDEEGREWIAWALAVFRGRKKATRAFLLRTLNSDLTLGEDD